MEERSENELEEQEAGGAATENIASGVCLNCETPLTGNFCVECGQSSDTSPYTMKTLLGSLFQTYRKFDSEMRGTFMGLLF
ncbi:MAG: hypothetical protein KDB79_12095, partial [Acidobacteria bacterium]|nr:hypothetical protein [Acidobacteriota bacterium]